MLGLEISKIGLSFWLRFRIVRLGPLCGLSVNLFIREVQELPALVVDWAGCREDNGQWGEEKRAPLASDWGVRA